MREKWENSEMLEKHSRCRKQPHDKSQRKITINENLQRNLNTHNFHPKHQTFRRKRTPFDIKIHKS